MDVQLGANGYNSFIRYREKYFETMSNPDVAQVPQPVRRRRRRLTLPSVTRRNRRKHFREIRKAAAEQLNQFKQLQQIDSQTRSEYLSVMRKSAIVIEHHRYLQRQNESKSVMLIVGFGVTLLSMIFPVWALLITHQSYQSQFSFAILIGIISGTYVPVLFITLLPAFFILSPKFRVSWFPSICFVYILLIYAAGLRYKDAIFLNPVVLGMLGTVVYLTAGTFFGLISVYVEKLSQRRIRMLHPIALAILTLNDTLSAIEQNPKQWTEEDFKNQLLEKIEKIAVTIEQGLADGLHPMDANTDVWLKQHCERIAAAIRELKTWILFPQMDTREHFMEQISNIFVCVVQGDWHNLPQAEPPSTLSFRAQLVQKSKILSMAVFPLGWLAFQQLRPDLTGPLAEAITIAAYAWLLAVILDVLDVDISVLSEIFNFFPGLGKKP